MAHDPGQPGRMEYAVRPTRAPRSTSLLCMKGRPPRR